MTYLPTQKWGLEVQKAKVGKHGSVDKFGQNTDVDGKEDVWDGGGVWVAPTTARTHDIVSTSTNDDGDPAGTGAQTVVIEGLDAGNALQTETVTMNGTTNVATANTYVMIHRMYVGTPGSIGTNDGDITATAQTDATVTAMILTGNGQTMMAIYKVPASKTAYVWCWYGSLGDSTGVSGGADIQFRQVPNSGADRLLGQHGVLSSGTSHFSHLYVHPRAIAALTIVRISVGSVIAANTDVSGGFEFTLVDD